ncbi:MAG TPA: transposase [Cyclobacteriaceae bacterium]|nr:transposase [Cyclobacteriaceae bacterium]
MTRTKRVFTPEERLSLLQEIKREGFSETCRKHNLSPSLMALWRKKYLAIGTEGLKPSYRREDPQVKALEEENERFKRIVARMAMELEVKTEMLKNSYSIQEKREVMKRFSGRVPVKHTARWIYLSRRSHYYKLIQDHVVNKPVRIRYGYGYDMINDELRKSGF